MTMEQPSPVRILLLEDEPFIRQTIRLMLRAFDNIELRDAVDGTQGFKLLDGGFAPDVVLCDVQMAPMGGLAFLRQLRETTDPVRLALPVVMLTGASDSNTVQAANSLGVSHYLVKPISLTRLAERLSAVLGDEKPLHKAAPRIPR